MLAGVAAGYAISRLIPSSPAKLGERILALSGVSLEKEDPEHPNDLAPPLDISPAFAREVGQADVDYTAVLWAVPTLAPHASTEACSTIREFLRKRFGPEQADLVYDYLTAWNHSDSTAFDRLKARSNAAEPARYSNYVTGRIEMRRKNYQSAYEYFHKEGERPNANESHYMAVHALLEAKNFPALAKLVVDPHYGRYVSPYVSMQIAIGQRDWRGILRTAPLAQIASYEPAILTVTLIAGLAWAFFLGHLGELPGLASKPALLCLVALGTGILSTVPTVYLVIWEEDFLHFNAGKDLVSILAYNIGGVGLREELCKLLLFLPLLPFLVRRDNELEALIVASFVGLGFAIEENCSYFLMSEAASAPGRFLSANFFHITLTGVNGLALFRATTSGRAGWNEFLFVFPVTVLVHGGYDALPDLPGVEGGGYFAIAVYVGFAAFYFKRLHPLRTNARTVFGLTGSFVAGISVVAAAVIAFEMVDLGPIPGLTAIVPELLSTAVLLFIFFREFAEELTP